MAVGSFVLAMFNQFELMPYAESIAHLSNEPYRDLWENAVSICHNISLVVLILSASAFVIMVVYLIKSKTKIAMFGSLIAVGALLIGYFQINGLF